MLLYDMQELGGLEEYAVNLAIGLQDLGHAVSVLSTAWVPDDNQYKRRLKAMGVSFVEVPRWLSLPASDWPTKLAIIRAVTWFLTPVIYTAALLHLMIRRGSWEASFASAGSWVRERVNGVVAPDWRPAIGRAMLRWWRYRWRPSVMHIQGYTTNLLFAVEWGHRMRVPVVYEEHQTPDPQFDWWRGFQNTINNATVVVAVSEKSAEGLRTVCGVRRPVFVRGPLMPDPLVDGQALARQPTRGAEPCVTTVARLAVAKGLNYLLEAIAAVRTTHPDIRFAIYGDGTLRGELHALASRLGLDPTEIFKGPFATREALAQIMANTDLFVMSSVLEGQPLGLVEAMAYGCPIVTTAVGGIPELIEDGRNGLLCPPADPVCLAAKIRMAMDDPEMRRSLGREARRSYEHASFRPRAVCEHLLGIYRAALDEAAQEPVPSPRS